MALVEGVLALSDDVNKVTPGAVDETKQGVVSPLLPELTLETDDEILKELAREWTQSWTKYYDPIAKRQQENERYWLGKQYNEIEYRGNVGEARPLIDNLIFESIETFLPLATRANPEAVCTSSLDLVNQLVEEKLQDIADEVRLKLLIKDAARNWTLYFIGAMEMTWDVEDNRPCPEVIRPQRLILDPNATVRGGKYSGKRVGVYQKESAKDAIDRFTALGFPQSGEYITAQVESKLDTEIQYVKWVTPEMTFWTMGEKVLGKMKNNFWNYDQEQPGGVDDYGQPILDPATGQPAVQTIPGKNHFKKPQLPFVFLSVFNIGKHPLDDTNLVYQVLSIQDLINKRNRQLDRNNDNINGGWAISLEKAGMTKDEATEAVAAWREGGAVAVPGGNINEAVAKMIGQELPAQVYNQQADARNELRNIFGTGGSTPQGIKSEDTVRGKILAKGSDDSRIGGGISEYLEQFSDGIYNWIIQLLFVFDPEFADKIPTIDPETGKPFKLKITVKEGSMIPKDPLTRRNEAIDLFTAGGLDPLTLYERLEDPNPMQTAQRLALWLNTHTIAPETGIPQQPQLVQGGSPEAKTGQDATLPQPTSGPVETTSSQLLASVPTQ